MMTYAPYAPENPKVTDRGEVCYRNLLRCRTCKDRGSFKAFYSFKQQLELENANLSKIEKLRISIVFSNSSHFSAPAVFALLMHVAFKPSSVTYAHIRSGQK